MIFSKPLDRLVLEGRKTETRRPAKHQADGTLVPCRVKAGRDYAVQRGRGKPEVARIHILAVEGPEPVGQLGFTAARREGFKTTAAFRDYWMTLYDRAWPPVEPCVSCDGAGDADCPDCYRQNPADPGGPLLGEHAPGCGKCGACDGSGEQLAAIDDRDVDQRFLERHADTLVWVIRFELTESIRLLTPAARPAGTELGITHNPAQAMRDEPEAVEVELLGRYWREDAARRHTGARDRRSLAADLTRRLAS